MLFGMRRMSRCCIKVTKFWPGPGGGICEGSGDWVMATVDRIRRVSAAAQRQVAVMMDVKGPEIRTGVVTEPIDLQAGD